MDTGAAAAVNVVVQAFSRGKFTAGAKLKETLNEVDVLANGVSTGIGAEVKVGIFLLITGEDNSWKFFCCCDFNKRIKFVVFEDDIVAGLMLLDEIGFEEKGFCFVSCGDVINLVNLRNHGGCFECFVVSLKVGGNPFPKVDGFADVDDFSLFIFHEVDTREFGKRVYLFGFDNGIK